MTETLKRIRHPISLWGRYQPQFLGRYSPMEWSPLGGGFDIPADAINDIRMDTLQWSDIWEWRVVDALTGEVVAHGRYI